MVKQHKDLDKTLDELVKEDKKKKATAKHQQGGFKNVNRKKQKKNHVVNKRKEKVVYTKKIVFNGDRKHRRERKTDRQRGNSNGARSKILQVGNLDFKVSCEDLQDIFSKCGAVQSVIMEKNAKGKFLGVADICYSNPKEAEKALKYFSNAELDGRVLCISYKH
ncbi:unnamed protein product [Moneuplotes crassus]|uniref:RRM domain-containing protein n=1 Tax=Euplotes crassus TaxID=5936 RepID=A0AAD1XYY6_EUPCR|nr:unnamed protein product [Moneuplotes crassus]